MKNVAMNNEEGIDELEDYLTHSLPQIQPNPEYVYRLQRRLFSKPGTILESRNVQSSYLVFACALFSGLLIMWLIKYLLQRKS
jgi:hypothetical protein